MAIYGGLHKMRYVQYECNLIRLKFVDLSDKTRRTAIFASNNNSFQELHFSSTES